MASSLWPALAGFVLGSAQGLVLDWLRNRAQHRRQLRLLRAELRRLGEFRRKWNWKHNLPPIDDSTPIPPRITSSYQRVIQDLDFWLTDEHTDDNSQLGLINIADGATVLEQYSQSIHTMLDQLKILAVGKKELLARAVDTALLYDEELDRWHLMVRSAVSDVTRRLSDAGFPRQVVRSLRAMPKGHNPPPLPPIGGTGSE